MQLLDIAPAPASRTRPSDGTSAATVVHRFRVSVRDIIRTQVPLTRIGCMAPFTFSTSTVIVLGRPSSTPCSIVRLN